MVPTELIVRSVALFRYGSGQVRELFVSKEIVHGQRERQKRRKVAGRLAVCQNCNDRFAADCDVHAALRKQSSRSSTRSSIRRGVTRDPDRCAAGAVTNHRL